MDDWGFEIWIVPLALCTSLSYLAAYEFHRLVGQPLWAQVLAQLLTAISRIGLGITVLMMLRDVLILHG
jgi:hypothetical protein